MCTTMYDRYRLHHMPVYYIEVQQRKISTFKDVMYTHERVFFARQRDAGNDDSRVTHQNDS